MTLLWTAQVPMPPDTPLIKTSPGFHATMVTNRLEERQDRRASDTECGGTEEARGCWELSSRPGGVQRGSNTLPAHASTVRFHGVHYEADGVVFIPAASIKGVVGGGEGEGSDTHRRAAGGGFGVSARLLGFIRSVARR